MGQMITPSPTPSIDELLPSLPPFVDEVDNAPAQNMNASRHGGWGYGTPPREEDALHSHESLLSSSHDASLASHWKPSASTSLEQQSSAPNQRFTHFDTLGPDLEGRQTRSHPVNSAATRGSTDIRNHVLGRQARDDRSEWDSPRSTRPRKRTASKIARKGKKTQFPDLVEPLSKWAKANGIQPEDVHSFATRDIEKRIAQAIKNGYVKRNLNVFFLYKRAYGAVAQAWMEIHHPTLAKTQPPLVTLVGESWARESDEFKQSYTFYSELEKDGLRNAFPHYKYKPGAKKGQLGVTSAKEPQGIGEESNSHKGGSTGCSGQGRQTCRESSTGLNQDHSSVQAQANENTHMDEVPISLGGQPLLAPQEPHYGPGSWSGSSEPMPIMGGYDNSFLYPGRAEWQTAFRGGGPRSASPEYSHHSHHQTNIIPIDPSLPDTYTDKISSRAPSEEPGYVVPSHTFASGASDVVSSRAMSSEPLFEGASDLTDPNSAWQPQMAASRGVSEEPWQQAPDSILSSLPLGSGSAYQTLVSDGDEWHLEAIDQDEQLQPFTWGLSDWTHGLDD